MKRRDFIKTTIATGLAAIGTQTEAEAAAKPSALKPVRTGGFNPIAVSTYSFWRFMPDSKLPIETCIQAAAELGFDGVDVLQIQMEDNSNSYLQTLKRTALVNGVDLCNLSTHQGFVSPDKDKRQKRPP